MGLSLGILKRLPDDVINDVKGVFSSPSTSTPSPAPTAPILPHLMPGTVAPSSTPQSIAGANIPSAFLAPPQPQSDPVANFFKKNLVQPIEQQVHSVANSPIAGAVKLVPAVLSGNQQARSNAAREVTSAPAIPSPTVVVNGKTTFNPAFSTYVNGMLVGGESGDLAATPEVPKPTVTLRPTEQDVANVQQTNPLLPTEPSTTEPVPTPPAGMKVAVAKTPTPLPTSEEMASLYNTAPPRESTAEEGNPADIAAATPISVPNPNPTPDPLSLPVARPGDFDQGVLSRNRVNNNIDENTNSAIDAVNQLSDTDKENFVNYAQGVSPISKAEDPLAVTQAVGAWRQLADETHAIDTTAGGTTDYAKNFFPNYLVKDGEVVEGKQNYQQGGFHSLRRVYPNQKTALENGETLLNPGDPAADIQRYAAGAKINVGGRVLEKAANEADALNTGPKGAITLKDGTTIKVSKDGEKALAQEVKPPLTNSIGKTVVKANSAVKQALISTGVPHLAIIPQRFLGALAALKIPPLEDLRDGDTPPPALNNSDLGHQIDSPIHGGRNSAGVSSTSTGAKYNPLTAPKRLVYDYLLPKMHDTLLSAAKDYMDKRGIDYNSPEAREIGHAINDVMGYSKNTHSAFNESTFAPALIKSTARMYAGTVKGGGAGVIARGGVVGQQLSNEVLGFVSKAISNKISQDQGKPQNKSKDNTVSTFLKEIYDPTLYTPYRNAKDEQVDLNVPGQYQADAARLLTNESRDKNGNLKFGLNNPSEIASNAAQEGKDIASPILGAGISAATNEAFNGSQIRNPYDSTAEQAEQTAVNTASNALPINFQGLVNNSVDKHLPASLQSSIELNKNTGPESLRIGGNTLGLNPKADTTTGQGPSVTQYYKGQQEGQDYIASHSNNITTQNATEDAYTKYFARSKNDQGQTVEENGSDRIANANMLLGNSTLLSAVQLAEKSNGAGNYDPMWGLPTNELKTFLQYQATPTGYPQRDSLLNQNSLLTPFINARDNYYANSQKQGTSVPAPGTPTYPTPDPATALALSQINTIGQIPESQRTATQEAQYTALYNQPNVIDAQQAIYQYDNAMQVNENVTPLQYLTPTDPATTAALATYDALPKGNGTNGGSPDRDAWITANPTAWNAITQMFANSDINTIEHQGAVAEFQGEQPSNSLLGAIKSAGTDDIASTPLSNGTTAYTLNPSLAFTQSSANDFSSTSSSSSSSDTASKYTLAREAKNAAKSAKYASPKNYSKTSSISLKAPVSIHPYKIKQHNFGAKFKVSQAKPTKRGKISLKSTA